MTDTVNSSQTSHLCRLYLEQHSFSPYPRFMTVGEHRSKDRFENWQLCGVEKLPFCDHTVIKLMQKCVCFYQSVHQPPYSDLRHSQIPPQGTATSPPDAGLYFRWDISVICLAVVLEFTVTVFISQYFQTFWPKWLNFFRSFQKHFGLWPKNDRKKNQTRCSVLPLTWIVHLLGLLERHNTSVLLELISFPLDRTQQ